MNRICRRFAENAEKFAHRPALVWRDGEHEQALCWRDFWHAVQRTKALLSRVAPTEMVFLLSENGIEWVLIHTACVCGNACVAALDPSLPTAELAAQIEKVGSGTVLYTDVCERSAQSLEECVDGCGFTRLDCDILLHGDESVLSCPDADENEAAMILFTSGTTGGGKGVTLTRRNLYTVLSYSESAGGYTKDDRTAALLPMFHAFGCVMQVYMPLFNGGAVCLTKGYKRMTLQLRALEVTILALVPALARVLLEELSELPSSDISAAKRLLPCLRLCYCGGAPLPNTVLEGLISHGFPIVEGYGASECTGLISSSLLEDRRPGSVGTVYPSCRVRIAEDGEILVQGESVMPGYFRDPDATQKVMTEDAWFHTGDLGHMDADGYLTVLGRKKSLILLENGKKVFPEEMEAQLEALPWVSEALVYARDSRLCALIHTADENAARLLLDNWNREQPDWRRLAAVRFSDTPLTRTHSGKKQRRDF